MLYVATLLDKPDHLAVRLATRNDHLAWIATHQEKIKAGGPFVDDAGAMYGSMLVIEAADRAELDAFLAEDPYARAGLFASVEVRGWRWVISPKG